MTLEEKMHRSQQDRAVLVSAFLDISLGTWLAYVQSHEDDTIPEALHDRIVDVIQALSEQDESKDSIRSYILRGNYLQVIAALSDEALLWIVRNIGDLNSSIRLYREM